tara:strand:- start:74 stop:610 length:537 start_codon:yes stop_codon:yes gene_type:complete
MMVEIVNPKTDEYLAIKKHVFSADFPWFWNFDSVRDGDGNFYEDGIPYFNHTLIQAPEYSGHPKENSQYAAAAVLISKQIMQANNIPLQCIYRASFNLTLPQLSKHLRSRLHTDHKFPHKNLLIYLNEVDGDTVLCDDKDAVISSESPKEDKAILFEGSHYHYMPTTSRRLVFVLTFI